MEKLTEAIVDDPYNKAQKMSVLKLERLLRHLSNVYYNTGKSAVPDNVFDILKSVLEEKDQNNSFLSEVGAPISKTKVKLPYFMASLDKIKPDTGTLDKWTAKYSGPYVLSDKLDGVSGLFVKKDGKVKLYTRGDGENGQNITHLIPYVFDSKFDKDSLPDDFAVRGELIISKENFTEIQDKMANARNAVAGLVNSKKYSQEVADITDFVAYSVVNPRMKFQQQMKTLKKYKFKTVFNATKKKLTNDDLSKLLVKRRKEGEYEIDGIVVGDSSEIHDHQDKNPDYAFAFKAVMTDQVAEAIVVDVLWEASKHGYLKPRVQIEPVNLVGVTITYATAFNAKFVVDNKLGPGAKIKLVRSGDVIPYIKEVIEPAVKPKMPNVAYTWTDTKVDILVEDMEGDKKNVIVMKQMRNFFEKLGVKHISEGILTKMVNGGFDSLEKVLTGLTKKPDKLAEIDGIGMTLIDKIKDGLDKALEKLTLDILMASSTVFGRGLGKRKLKLVVDKYPDIMDVKWTQKDMIFNLIEIDGFDTITAAQFAVKFPEFLKFYNKIGKIINLTNVTKKPKKKAVKSSIKTGNNPFLNAVVVFTGFRDKEAEAKIEDIGGRVATSVSGKTTLLVYKAGDTSSKLTKAEELGIKTVTKEEFQEMLD